MKLMRLGAPGSERPAVRLDDSRYIDVPDRFGDYDERFFGSGGLNDVSERAFQMERGGQWSKGKSAETFNPAGPWLVTTDEIDDVLDLDMWLDVDGVRRQTGSTSTMVFDPWVIVHHLSQFMVLQPGDVMELGVTGLGTQRQNVVGPR